MTTADLSAKRAIRIGATIGLIVLFYEFCIPYVDRFKVPARESSAVGRLRDIVFEQKAFRSQHGCYASELAQLPDVTSVDKYYAYAIVTQVKDEKGCVTKYIVTASPNSPHTKDDRYFSLDQNETLRFERTHPAGASSPVLN